MRYGLPITNKGFFIYIPLSFIHLITHLQSLDIRNIQASVESAKINIKTRRINFALNDVKTVKSLLDSKGNAILKTVPSNHMDNAKASMQRLKEDIEPLLASLNAETASGSGSLQERQNLDDSFAAQDKLSKELSTFEELMISDDYKVPSRILFVLLLS